MDVHAFDELNEAAVKGWATDLAVADDGRPIRNMSRDDALTWLREVATSACGSQFDARAWAAARVLLSALAGVPHPGVEAPRIWWSPSSPRPFLVEHDPRSNLPSPERRFRHLAPCDDYSALPHDAVPVCPATQREFLDECGEPT